MAITSAVALRWHSTGNGSEVAFGTRVNDGWVNYHIITTSNTAQTEQHISDVFYMAQNDYLDVDCYQTSGGNLDLNLGTYRTHMSICRVA